MKAMEELHVIVKTQKTTRISRLRKIVKRLALEIESRNKMIRAQKKTIDHLNRSHSQLQIKYDMLKREMDERLVVKEKKKVTKREEKK